MSVRLIRALLGALVVMTVAPAASTGASPSRSRQCVRPCNHQKHHSRSSCKAPAKRKAAACPCPPQLELHAQPATRLGPESLEGGIYTSGGKPSLTSACDSHSRAAAATITITSGGTVVTTETVGEGQRYKISLPAGTYAVSYALANGTQPPPPTATKTFTVPPGHTVMLDFIEQIP
jgi:hypothetical protein